MERKPALRDARCLVTGGGGYLGQRLAGALAAEGARVRVLDPRPGPPGTEHAPGDIRRSADVRAACREVDVVFHTAAALCLRGVVSPRERREVFDLNVGGTRNVLAACREEGVGRLVYTSSNNVTFDRPIVSGDERLPYARRFVDVYTRTKVVAEGEVLAADGEGGVRTLALRPGGIWGPGSEMLRRAIEAIATRPFRATIGDGRARADNVYVDNLVDAHLLAARALAERPQTVGGRAYFVTDGAPGNAFELLRPMLDALGLPFPRWRVPFHAAHALAHLAEGLCRVGGPPPFLTRMEVRKVAMSHSYRIDRARRELGYRPRVDAAEGWRRCLPSCRALLDAVRAERAGGPEAASDRVEAPHPAWWVLVLLGMGLLLALALDDGAWGAWSRHVAPFPPRPALRILAAAAVALHVGEGLWALARAARAGMRSAWGWWAQTTLLGYPSLRLLRRRLARGGSRTRA